MCSDATAKVAHFVAHARWADFPPAVQAKARVALLDFLGSATVGTQTSVAAATAAYATRNWSGSGATVLCGGGRTAPVGAAFANGYAANAVDIDDCSRRGHPGAQIFATALAAGEARELSGLAVLEAAVVGYEVADRAAYIWRDVRTEFQACGAWGSVACAATAARLAGLPEQQIWHALGIADYNAPNLPMLRDIDHPAMVKHGIGWGAMTGMMAADLASLGFTGVPSVFSLPQYADLVADIGERYALIDGLGFKRYASCAWSHPPIDVVSRLLHESNIRVDEIASITVEASANAVRLGTRLPDTIEEAQFNLAWPLAVYLLYGEVGPRQMLAPNLADPAARDLVARVHAVESPDFTERHRRFVLGLPGGGLYTSCTVALSDGRSFSSGPVQAGVQLQVASEAEAEAKFLWLVRDLLDTTSAARLVDLVWRVDRLADIRELMAAATVS